MRADAPCALTRWILALGTPTEVARLAGVSRQHVYAWADGRAWPSLRSVDRVLAQLPLQRRVQAGLALAGVESRPGSVALEVPRGSLQQAYALLSAAGIRVGLRVEGLEVSDE